MTLPLKALRSKAARRLTSAAPLTVAWREFHTTPRPLQHQHQHQRKRQNSLPASYYRGGTSRAIMFARKDLPPDTAAWAAIFRGALGSPDPHGRQLDGLGGGVSSLSKVCVVGESEREDADVEYTFAAVGVKDEGVDFSSNCGNMLAAVGPFAVDRGIVSTGGEAEAEKVVRIFNTNTRKVIRARFGVEGGEAVAYGDFAIDGVAGTGARVELAFLDPAGSKTGRLLPTANPTDSFDAIPATCIDVGNPCVFVAASSLNLPDPALLPDALESDHVLLAHLERIRRQAGRAMGLCASEAACPASVPKIAVVSPPSLHRLLDGQELQPQDVDLVVRALSVGQPHRAVPVTVALALAAASAVEGSVVQGVVKGVGERVDETGVTIGHPSGRLLVTAVVGEDGRVAEATVFRTARRLFEGRVFWK